MYRRAWRLPAAALAVGALAVLGLSMAGAGRPVAAQDEGPIPCNPSAKRTVSKQVVKEGESFDVRVEYDYKCSNVKRKVNFIFLVENSQFLRGGEPTPGPFGADGASPQIGEQFASVKSALKQFINE